MAKYVLSQAADADLTDIYTYSYMEFGETQADNYFSSLEECLNKLAKNTGLGMDASSVRKNYRRFIHRRHTIFYVPNSSGIFVVRVLGPGMSPEKNLP